MGEFFHGWRRKIGVLALVMACLFAVGWVRSCWVLDTVTCPTGRWAIINLMSCDQRLGMARIHEQVYEFFVPIWQTGAFVDIDKNLDAPEILCHYRWWGFVSFEINDVSRTKIWLVPYWSVTIPPMLISIWMLISTSREPGRRKTPEFVPAETGEMTGKWLREWRRQLGVAMLFLTSMCAVSCGICRYNPELINGLFNNLLPSNTDGVINEGSIGLFTDGSSLSLIIHKDWDSVFDETSVAERSPKAKTSEQSNKTTSKLNRPLTDDEAYEIFRALNMELMKRCSLIAVPFWLIVTSLAVVSTYLLLSKPRPSNQKKITEPKANEGV